MRALVLALLLANLLAWAGWQGLLGAPPGGGGEPRRLQAQVAPERLRLLSAAELDAARERSRRHAVDPLAAIDFTAGPVCVELGDFAEPTAGDVRQRADALGLTDRFVARTVQSAGWTLVALPPARTRVEGERQVAAVRKQGVRAWLIEDAGPLRWAVALGAFRTAEAARLHLSAVDKLGVKGARLAPEPATVPALRLRIGAADAALGERLATLGREFPAATLALCAK